jgi:glycosyltransferase involved in cell wall biosynthesis
MHILNIIQCTNLGGMEKASLRLMKALKERGHTLSVVSLNPLGDLKPLLEKSGISATGLSYRGKGGWRSYRKLNRTIRSANPDAVLMTGHNLMAMFALGDLCKGRRILAQHYHHTGVKSVWQWKMIYRIAMRRFDAITFPSDFVRLEAESIFPQVASIAHTVRNPLEIPSKISQKERRLARQALDIPEGAPVIGNAGWLIERKRFDIFLKVASMVAQKMPDLRIIIAGDGPERSRLENLAQKLGISNSILWLGWCKDLQNFYHSIDVLLFTSDWDAYPTTPVEAMSYGIPVVASVKNGGLKEVISDKRYGFLCNNHALEPLSNAVIIAFSPHGRDIGRIARQRVMALSKPDNIAAFAETILRGH